MPGLGPGPGLFSGGDDGQGDPIRVMIDGTLRFWSSLSEHEKASWRAQHPERYRSAPSSQPGVAVAGLDETRKDLGLPDRTGDSQGESELMNALRSANIDPDNDQVAAWLRYTGDALKAGDTTFEAAMADVNMMSFNPELQATTPYLDALEAAGFSGPYNPAPTAGQAQLGRLEGMDPEEIFGKPPAFQESDLGWIQYANGVLVGPDDEVIIDPSSNAPGSANWLRAINDWSADKIRAWKDRLVEFGYLPKEAAKGLEVTTDFRTALKTFHYNRYVNGGTPLRTGEAGAGAAGPEAPKPIDLEEFSSQIRNDVREQYERIYGVRPGDGETELWSQYIIRQGMAMQRRNIKKYDTPMTDTAASEAEEKFIEKLEHTPEAKLLRSSEEENTRLRDTLTRMAQVTDSLVT